MELYDRRGDPIPEGWGCDAQGHLTTDPKRVLSGGGLVPIGGSEATGEKSVDATVRIATDIQLSELKIKQQMSCIQASTSHCVSVTFRRVQRLRSGNDGGGVLWDPGWRSVQ